jgi:hypothetical protein
VPFGTLDFHSNSSSSAVEAGVTGLGLHLLADASVMPAGSSPRGRSPRGSSPRGISPSGRSPRGSSPRGSSPGGSPRTPLTYVGPNAAVQSYCRQEISPALNSAVLTLLQSIKGFQDRAIAKNPVKVGTGRYPQDRKTHAISPGQQRAQWCAPVLASCGGIGNCSKCSRPCCA